MAEHQSAVLPESSRLADTLERLKANLDEPTNRQDNRPSELEAAQVAVRRDVSFWGALVGAPAAPDADLAPAAAPDDTALCRPSSFLSGRRVPESAGPPGSSR